MHPLIGAVFMSTQYYYEDNNGHRWGPVSGGRLKGLAKAGIILPETIIETNDGKRARARQVKGLTFVDESVQVENLMKYAREDFSESPFDAPPPSEPNQPSPTDESHYSEQQDAPGLGCNAFLFCITFNWVIFPVCVVLWLLLTGCRPLLLAAIDDHAGRIRDIYIMLYELSEMLISVIGRLFAFLCIGFFVTLVFAIIIAGCLGF